MTLAIDIPAGTVPPLKEFTRHLWRYQDEHGRQALLPPPGPICVFYFNDPNDANSALHVAEVVNSMSGDESITVEFDGPVALRFRHLTALHSFLKMLTLHPSLPMANRVAHACLINLGFRWRS